jgi:hypothetical protein
VLNPLVQAGRPVVDCVVVEVDEQVAQGDVSICVAA